MKKRMVDRQLESMFFSFWGGGEGMQPRFTWIGFPWFLVTTMGFTSHNAWGSCTVWLVHLWYLEIAVSINTRKKHEGRIDWFIVYHFMCSMYMI